MSAAPPASASAAPAPLASLTEEQSRLASDLGREAARRCARTVCDLACLTGDHRQDFIIAAYAIAALTGFAGGSLERAGGEMPENPSREVMQAVLDYVGQVLLPLACGPSPGEGDTADGHADDRA